MNVYRIARWACGVIAAAMALAMIVAGFAVGFGWQMPEHWNGDLLLVMAYVVMAAGVVGIPFIRLLETEA